MPAKSIASRKAFTLIELLVVVAIIALLIAILLPAISNAKNRAYTATCLSNVRQSVTANNLYANEWNGIALLPSNYVSPDLAGNQFIEMWYCGQYGFTGAFPIYNPQYGGLAPYLGYSAKMAACPTGLKFLVPYSQPAFPKDDSPPISNYAFSAGGIKINNVTNPAQTAGVAEAATITSKGILMSNEVSAMLSSVPVSMGSKGQGPNVWAPHSKTGAVGWMDGHASMEAPYMNLDSTNVGTKASLLPFFKQYNFGYLTPVDSSVPIAQMKSMNSNTLNGYLLMDRTGM